MYKAMGNLALGVGSVRHRRESPAVGRNENRIAITMSVC